MLQVLFLSHFERKVPAGRNYSLVNLESSKIQQEKKSKTSNNLYQHPTHSWTLGHEQTNEILYVFSPTKDQVID